MRDDYRSKKRMTTLNSISLFCILFSRIATASQPITDYLLKPTGQYNVAFKEIHWVRQERDETTGILNALHGHFTLRPRGRKVDCFI